MGGKLSISESLKEISDLNYSKQEQEQNMGNYKTGEKIERKYR